MTLVGKLKEGESQESLSDDDEHISSSSSDFVSKIPPVQEVVEKKKNLYRPTQGLSEIIEAVSEVASERWKP